MEGLRTAIMAMSDRPDALHRLAARVQLLREEAAFLLAADDPGHVFFIEARGRAVLRRRRPSTWPARCARCSSTSCARPCSTSATLAVDGGFTYLKARLGLEPTWELLLPSPFDFARQAVLYVPRNMPEPQSPLFVERAAEEIRLLLTASRGRAFVLCTSYANMNAFAERLAGQVPYPLLVQG